MLCRMPHWHRQNVLFLKASPRSNSWCQPWKKSFSTWKSPLLGLTRQCCWTMRFCSTKNNCFLKIIWRQTVLIHHKSINWRIYYDTLILGKHFLRQLQKFAQNLRHIKIHSILKLWKILWICPGSLSSFKPIVPDSFIASQRLVPTGARSIRQLQ